jgi:Arc/MetJ-type ribon-helix-helix transcriptional regulator
MDTTLPPKIEQLIAERLRRGSYKTVTEVIEDAFDALTERENFQAIHAELRLADEQLARGEYTEYDENSIENLAGRVKHRGQARLAEERKTNTQ